MERENHQIKSDALGYVTTISFGRGASKSTTQGGIFDLNMYITFDCAEIAAF